MQKKRGGREVEVDLRKEVNSNVVTAFRLHLGVFVLPPAPQALGTAPSSCSHCKGDGGWISKVFLDALSP